MEIWRTAGRAGRRVALVLAAVTVGVTTYATPAAAHQVAPMPSGNLIGTPWFSTVVAGQLRLNTTGWVTLRALVYGAPSPTGPWTQVWTPFQHTQTVSWQPSPTEPRSETWKHFTSLPGKFDDWFAPVPKVVTLPQGFAYYKVELRASYPTPDSTATGGVGGKLTGVYFATSA